MREKMLVNLVVCARLVTENAKANIRSLFVLLEKVIVVVEHVLLKIGVI
jgi:hypothetical protein